MTGVSGDDTDFEDDEFEIPEYMIKKFKTYKSELIETRDQLESDLKKMDELGIHDEIDTAIFDVKMSVIDGNETSEYFDGLRLLANSDDPRAIRMFMDSIFWQTMGFLELKENAIKVLGRSGKTFEDEAIELLSKTFLMGRKGIERSVDFTLLSIKALGEFDSPDAVNLLVAGFFEERLEDRKFFTRQQIIMSLSEIAGRNKENIPVREALENVVEPLFETVKDDRFSETQEGRGLNTDITRLLSEIAGENLVDQLIEKMNETDDWFLKGDIAIELSKIGDLKAYEHILELYLSDSADNEIYKERQGAFPSTDFIRSLGYFRDSRAMDTLIDSMYVSFRNVQRNYKHGWDFRTCITALGLIGNSDAIEHITSVYARAIDWQLNNLERGERGYTERVVNRNNTKIRRCARNALIAIGTKSQSPDYIDDFFQDSYSKIENPEMSYDEYLLYIEGLNKIVADLHEEVNTVLNSKMTPEIRDEIVEALENQDADDFTEAIKKLGINDNFDSIPEIEEKLDLGEVSVALRRMIKNQNGFLVPRSYDEYPFSIVHKSDYESLIFFC